MTGPLHGMDPDALDAAIRADREAGRVPAAIVACLGGTGIGACDRSRRSPRWHSGTGCSSTSMPPGRQRDDLSEFRDLMRGAELADSLVFNPHKWLFTHSTARPISSATRRR